MPTSNGSARLIRIFLSELDERLSSFDADLSALAEPAPEADRAETVTRLFRGAHSLKGAAASVGASGIESVCQHLEDVLAKVRDGALALDAERCAMLVAAAGEVREAARRLANEAAPPPAAAAPAPPPAPVPVPAPAPPPRRAASRIQARADTLRVPAERVDALLEHSGELLVSHHRIDDLLRQVDEAASTVQRLHTAPPGAGRKQHREQLRELHRSLERIATSMQAERLQLQSAATALDERIRSIRMLPFGVACEGLERVVHDTAEATGKQV
ncbi:MAG: Hpt domain-containing protein, partial [Candidatus Lustribacter sp.]